MAYTNGVTQYIGARYVPKFYENSDGNAEWRSGVQYEPLTIVTYNGNSYTSKRPVPSNIGNPSDNGFYWVSTGLYNEQVENLRQNVVALAETVSEQGDEIDAMTPIVNRFGKRKVIFIGDSFCGGNVGGSGLAHGIYTIFCQRANLTDGTDAKLYAQGGAGFIANAQGKTFMDLAEEAVAEAAFNADDVTDIIVATAGNDGGQSMGNINTARAALFNYLHSNYPNATIYIAVVGGTTDGANRNQILNVVQTACYYTPAHYVKPVYNAVLPMWFYNSYSDDGIHPNLNGCQQIGHVLARAFLEETTLPQLKEFNYNATLGAISGEVTKGATFYISPATNFLRIMCTDSPTLANEASFTYNQGGLIKLGSADNSKAFLVPNVVSLNGNIIKHIHSDLYVYKTGEQWVHVFGEILIVKETTSTATVYFKAKSSPETVSSTNIRMGEGISNLTPTGYI